MKNKPNLPAFGWKPEIINPKSEINGKDQNIENKPNVNLGKIGARYYLTSKYERF